MLATESKAAGCGVAGPPNATPNGSWKHLVEPVEPFLETVTQQLIRQVQGFDPQIVPYARYALDSSGKQLRPTLVALAARTLGPVTEGHVTAAVIIEMVHLATLVHDDVMDEAEIRRGQPTLAANWGNEIAVLFGDCLFAQAVKLAASFPTPEVCRAVAVAVNTVCTGEILQTQQRRKFALSHREYFRVIEMKTAELFALSCDLAAFLGGATVQQRQALREFGMAFGTAYQVYDDCMDLFGTEALAGKSLGTDLEQGKLTWPVLLVWERAGKADRAQLEKLIERWSPEHLAGVNDLLARYGAFEPTMEVVGQQLERARRALRTLPESSGQAGLLGLTDFLAQQMEVLAV
ncbi:MAG TPA: polyprenyl synthetase family protein [Verrucomicrobiae bacterium]|nr:polyprenyl synthetase family protein [Verrucomicrobiae bacterium]